MPDLTTLTSRERVRRLLRREPVDRLPIDLGMHPSSGISAFAYQRLRRHLGLPADTVDVHDCVQLLARVDDDIRSLINIFGHGGGFVFNQVHNIMADVPPENIVALLDTAYAASFAPAHPSP